MTPFTLVPKAQMTISKIFDDFFAHSFFYPFTHISTRSKTVDGSLHKAMPGSGSMGPELRWVVLAVGSNLNADLVGPDG